MSERKYRQQGYQDHGSEGESRSKGRAPKPRDPSAGPRGRGLGKPTASVFRCSVCGAKQSSAEIVNASTCIKCRADLRTCTHCRHFDSSQPNECRQPVGERVGGKAKANDCPLFAPKESREFAVEAPSTHDAKSAFDALFKF